MSQQWENGLVRSVMNREEFNVIPFECDKCHKRSKKNR